METILQKIKQSTYPLEDKAINIYPLEDDEIMISLVGETLWWKLSKLWNGVR